VARDEKARTRRRREDRPAAAAGFPAGRSRAHRARELDHIQVQSTAGRVLHFRRWVAFEVDDVEELSATRNGRTPHSGARPRSIRCSVLGPFLAAQHVR
jgi:hypothetical protein